ncbi:MAG: CvpA family protein, partial [Kangiellaceae bacterium]|nr:CvpA family protein [Kangiellaceae bacterium]
MNISYLIFFVVTLYFAYQGYSKGVAKLSFRFIALVLAYVAALIFTRDLAPIVTQHTSVDGILSYVSAGLLLFFVTNWLVDKGLLQFYQLVTKNAGELATIERISGSALGIVIGVFFGFILVWTNSVATNALTKQPARQVSSSSATQ